MHKYTYSHSIRTRDAAIGQWKRYRIGNAIVASTLLYYYYYYFYCYFCCNCKAFYAYTNTNKYEWMGIYVNHVLYILPKTRIFLKVLLLQPYSPRFSDSEIAFRFLFMYCFFLFIYLFFAKLSTLLCTPRGKHNVRRKNFSFNFSFLFFSFFHYIKWT